MNASAAVTNPAGQVHPDGSAKTESPILDMRDLKVSFHNGSGPRIQAVNGATMTVYPRQTLAVVGESGCGKSVSAMSILQLNPCPPCNYDGGEILFQGRDLLKLSEKQMQSIRGSEIAMIFQEPMTSLNPVFTIGSQIIEAIQLHQKVSKREAEEKAVQAMADVGIPDPQSRLRQYPHQFSGGMRQRVMIAMALACEPSLLLADEPTTALDVTIQAQILELIDDLKRSRDLAIILITHDLGVVAENADVVCVMYAGRVVEYARVFNLFETPTHPYTRGLFNSIPKLGDVERDRLVTIRDVIDNPREFELLGDGLIPWWPGHEAPAGVIPGPDGSPHILIELSEDHWVGCWRNEAALAMQSRSPDLNFRKSASDVQEVIVGADAAAGDGSAA